MFSVTLVSTLLAVILGLGALGTSRLGASFVRIKLTSLQGSTLRLGFSYIEPVEDPEPPLEWRIGETMATLGSETACKLEGSAVRAPASWCTPSDGTFFYRHLFPGIRGMLFENQDGQLFFATYDASLEKGVVFSRSGEDWSKVYESQEAGGPPYLQPGRSGRVVFPRGHDLRYERQASTGQTVAVNREGQLIYRPSAETPWKAIDTGVPVGAGWQAIDLDERAWDMRVLYFSFGRQFVQGVEVDLKDGRITREWRLPVESEHLRDSGKHRSPTTTTWERSAWGSAIRTKAGRVFVVSRDLLHWTEGGTARTQFGVADLSGTEPKTKAIDVR